MCSVQSIVAKQLNVVSCLITFKQLKIMSSSIVDARDFQQLSTLQLNNNNSVLSLIG